MVIVTSCALLACCTQAGNERASFAEGLFSHWCATTENSVFSPYSLSVALGMTAAGAQGESAQQIVDVLGLGATTASLSDAFVGLNQKIDAATTGAGVTFRTANALFPQPGHPFKEAYLTVLRTCFHGDTQPLNYRASEAARQTINDWVAEKTEQKITDLIPQGALAADTRLTLVNAVYFKGAWQRPFNPSQTRPRTFTSSNADALQVPFMHQTGSYAYSETAEAQLLEIPYAGGRLALTLLLPKPGATLAQAAAPLFQNHAKAGLRTVSATIAIPKFTFSSFQNAETTLRLLGIRDVFDPGHADLSAMDGTRDLSLTAVVHQAFIEVNETGTEAAAATGAVMSTTSLPPPPEVTFIADRPFAFAIRENASGTLLFLGTLANPK